MEMVAQMLAVIGVLGILGLLLWWLRSRGMAAFTVGRNGGGRKRRLQSLERLPLSPQHSLHLVRYGDKVLLVGLSPGSCTVLESGRYEPYATAVPGVGSAGESGR
jgi:flagellar biogenesis protein FliO